MFTIQARCRKTGRVLRERTAPNFHEAVELSKSERKVFSWWDEKLTRSFLVPVDMIIMQN